MDQNDEDESQLSLSESFNSIHVSEEAACNDNGKPAHILHNVEEWKSRKDAKEKAEAVEKIQQFKVKIIALEKEKSSQLYGKKSEFRKDFCELEEHEVRIAAERSKERESIQNKIQRISSNVKKFRSEIEGPKSTHDFLEKLKILMEEIESSILKYKQQQGVLYDEMMKEEKQLNIDLESFEKKMQSWNTSVATLSSHTKTKQQNDKKTVSVPPEVTAFQRYLAQTGGHQGGWDEYDHQAFLKLKKKYKVFDEFIENAESEIPTRSRDDIKQHDEWYREYLALREHKRMAIAKWKNMKESEKQEKLQKVENDAESERLRELRRRDMIEKEKMERFAQLEKWKLDKELQRQKEEETKERLRAEEILRKGEDEQKRREETKARVFEYQMRKKEEEEILKLSRKVREEEEKKAKKISEEEQARIKERDEKILENKRRRLEQKDKEKREKEKRLNKLRSQVEVQVERDPSRLYKLTEGWKERNKSTRSEKSQPQLHFQRRAVPNWRQGMS